METLQKPKTGSRRKVHQDQTPREVKPTNGVDADTFLVWLGTIESELALLEAAKKRYGKVWKLALNAGIERKSLEYVMKLADQDPEAVLRGMAKIKQYAEWMNVPIGGQLTLLELPTTAIPTTDERQERARKVGYTLGITGKNPDEQAYPVDNECHQAHMEGWHAGQKVLLDRIQPIEIAIESADKPDKQDEPAAPAAEPEQEAA